LGLASAFLRIGQFSQGKVFSAAGELLVLMVDSLFSHFTWYGFCIEQDHLEKKDSDTVLQQTIIYSNANSG
jgi:hypothetical protein